MGEFKALLFIPSSPPQGMFEGATPKDNMKLFVRRVFITDDFSDILPKYLSFIKGLVDSDDLPLNVSREQLQQHKTLKIIKKKLIRKAIAMFQTLAKDGGEDWDKFWDNYGTNIKLGVIEDASNRARLSKLLQFVSSKTGELTTLEAYVERMKKDQDQIYYLGGETRDAVEKSPLLERVVKRGFEVLIMTEPIDEYAVANMPKFDGKYTLDNEDLDKVILSKRLTTSPSAIVSPSFGYTANMQRIVRNQALGDPQAKTGYMMNNKLTMELNPFHPIVKRLLAHVQAEEAGDEDKDVARLLFDTAKLQSGFPIEKPADFGAAVVNFLSKSLGVQDDEVEEFEEGEAPDQEEEEEEDEDEEDEEDEEEEATE